mmetsp:Transcript_138186/g.429568  ORF Transcript_138186/g.429568 Transcript_138186/m.429568 type:complete len:340 (+) Transcript_138186:52-1071(+)
MLRVPIALASFVAVARLGTAFEDQDIDGVSLLQHALDPILRNASLATPVVAGQLPQNVTHLAAGLAAKPVPGIQPASVFHSDYIHDGPWPSTTSQPPVSAAPTSSQDHHGGLSMRSVVAEYIAMTLFVTIGCGSAMAIARDEGSAWVLQVALTFGFAVTALAYSLGRYSGGQINCAVTLALWVSGEFGFSQAILNFIAQVLGSITGALFLCVVFPEIKDKTGCIGCNEIREGFNTVGVLFAELLMTFLLCMVVLESGHVGDPASGISAICIGLAVFVAHCVLIPIDGCSINPTRSFGPALVATLREDGKGGYFRDMWVFWVGPLLGALAAAGVHALLIL